MIIKLKINVSEVSTLFDKLVDAKYLNNADLLHIYSPFCDRPAICRYNRPFRRPTMIQTCDRRN